MSSSWQPSEGEVLGGKYPLLACLHSDDDTAVYQTETGEARTPAIVQVARVEASRADYFLTRWRALARISNPGLLRVLDCGPASDHEPILFLVTESPDDNLAGVLKDRALGEQETLEIAEAVSSALEEMHRTGMAHGYLDERSVYATAGKIKISGDGLFAPRNAKLRDDVWAFGLLLLTCLRQQPPPTEQLAEVAATLPDPLRPVVVQALNPDASRRPNMGRLRSILHGESVEPQKPAMAALLGDRRWQLVAGLGVLALLFVAWVIHWSRSSETPKTADLREPAPAVSTTVPEPAPSPKPSPLSPPAGKVLQVPITRQSAARTRTEARPLVTHPAESHSAETHPAEAMRSRTVDAGRVPRSTGDRYVIVATYNRRVDAEKRAKSISSKYPKFPANVYSPRQPNPPFFVVIGENLTKEDALRLKDRARAAGLPHDTYVQAL